MHGPRRQVRQGLRRTKGALPANPHFESPAEAVRQTLPRPAARELCMAVALTVAVSAYSAESVPTEPVGHIVVGGTDTLWSIAAEVHGDDRSIAETMRAIVRANPDAFTAGDPDRLRAGARLTLPWARPGEATAPPGNDASPEPSAEAEVASTGADTISTIERLTSEIAVLRAEVARGVEAQQRAQSQRDRLLEENASLREASDVAAAADTAPPQQRPPVGDRQPRPSALPAAFALLLGIAFGVGGSAGWQRWRRRAAPAPHKQRDASSLRDLAARVHGIAAPVGATEPTARDDAEPATPDDIDAINAVAGDSAAMNLKLARAYIDIGDRDRAADVLKEVSEQGNPDQRALAAELLQRL